MIIINELTKDLAKILVSEGVCNELDKDVYYDFYPKEPDNIVILNEYLGTGIATFTDTSVRSVQVTVRNTSNIMAKNKAYEVLDVFHKDDLFLMVGQVMTLTSLRSLPYKLKVDEKGRHVWTFSLGITYRYRERKES